MKNLINAIALASALHRDQKRLDASATPYINHPIAVAKLLFKAGVEDEDILCSALLHDVVEDCAISITDINNMFNARIAMIVDDVTDPVGLDGEDRKLAQIEKVKNICNAGKLIKVADKICNLRDVLESPPNWSIEKKLKYFNFAQAVFDSANIDNEYLKKIFLNLIEKKQQIA